MDGDVREMKTAEAIETNGDERLMVRPIFGAKMADERRCDDLFFDRQTHYMLGRGVYTIETLEFVAMIESADDTKALNRLQEVLRPSNPLSVPSGPTALLDYLYIGGFEEAEDLDQLRRLGITHVLNCAAEPGRLQRGRYASNPYPPESGIYAYDQFSALDIDGYDIMQHFPRAEVFINRAKYSGGKVLVHCAAGVNRSGAICVAYVMVDKKLSLFEAVRRVRAKRDVLLTNIGFRKQLVSFARRRGFL